MLFDSHAHFEDVKFDGLAEDGRTLRESLLAKAFGDDGVLCIVNAGTSIENSRKSVALAHEYERIYAAVGLHPEELDGAEADPDGTLSELRRLISAEKVCVIGEIGLDYHGENPDRELQKRWFDIQMKLALETGLPVQIHDRDAHGDCMEIVRKNPGVRGVFHSFSGSAEMARELLSLGWYISFSGVVTFKNATRMAEVVRAVPADRMLAETDCPYLAPHPLRGQLNYSGYVKYTVSRLAELKELSYEEMSLRTFENACTLFGIDSEILLK